MQEIKSELLLKNAKENKDQQSSKKKTSSSEKAWDWQPIAIDLSISAAKGIISGFALKLGSEIYSQSFSRNVTSSSLKVLDGGKTSMAI